MSKPALTQATLVEVLCLLQGACARMASKPEMYSDDLRDVLTRAAALLRPFDKAGPLPARARPPMTTHTDEPGCLHGKPECHPCRAGRLAAQSLRDRVKDYCPKDDPDCTFCGPDVERGALKARVAELEAALRELLGGCDWDHEECGHSEESPWCAACREVYARAEAALTKASP